MVWEVSHRHGSGELGSVFYSVKSISYKIWNDLVERQPAQ